MELIKILEKEKSYGVTCGCSWLRPCHADVNITSPVGFGLLTSIVGHADIIIGQVNLTVDQSTIKVWGLRSDGPTGQPHEVADRWAPRVRCLPKMKKKRIIVLAGLNRLKR